MPKIERFNSNRIELATAMSQAFEKARAFEKSRSVGSIDIIVGTGKQDIAHIGIVVEETGRSLHIVNAILSSKVPLKDTSKDHEYPDIIIYSKTFDMKTVLKKFSEFLFLKHNIQDISVRAFRNAADFRNNNQTGYLDPKTGILETAA